MNDRMVIEEATRFVKEKRAIESTNDTIAVANAGVTGRDARLTVTMVEALIRLARPAVDAAEAEDRKLAEYRARAVPRLELIDRISTRIDFADPNWRSTPKGEQWQHLMDQQARDEADTGL